MDSSAGTGRGIFIPRWFYGLTALLLVILGISAWQDFSVPGNYSKSFFALDTVFEITILDTSEDQGTRILEKMKILTADFENTWSSRNQKSRLWVLNQKGGAGFVVPDPDMVPLLERSMMLSRLSGGLFNPCLLPLTSLWDIVNRTVPPSKKEISEAMGHCVAGNYFFESTKPGEFNVSIPSGGGFDLGGVAKGLAIDGCAEIIAREGKRGLVNAGGDIAAVGRRDNGPWRIGVRDPRGNGILAVIQTDGGSIVTSGDYERFFIYEGKRYHHILDPATGYPASGIISVTVTASDTVTADAAATAGMVAGPERVIQVCRSMGALGVMAITADGRHIVSEPEGGSSWITWIQ